jgi:HPt (histidine-containing phosphotransfer) domain-containing protein
MMNAVDSNVIDSGNTCRIPTVPWRLAGALADLERAGESEFVRDLIDAFLRDTATRLESMKRAAASMDLDALASCSHALKGSMLLMSADRLAELCCDIEHHAAGRKHWDYPAMVDQLDLVLRETREAMVSHADGLPRHHPPTPDHSR